ncbi:MAG: L,D-transpeptidase family protein [Akkermansiaceae bacterium]|jgi:lipoprotein-anchoring transpeptidase ErfK/SrfK|nr:L,D-transpeptidase family protein [Akkermansiaceae bacterium]
MFLRLGFLLLALGSAHAEEVARALPVDPSVITPDSGIDPTVPPVVESEAKPLPPGEVDLPATKPNPRSDAPDLTNMPDREDAVRLQIFLDENHFGPGVIDGKPGRFTILAANAWNEVHGHPENDFTALLAAARKAVPSPFATATVPSAATAWVNAKLPFNRTEQAKAKRMSYRSYGEFMAERYHTDVEFLVEINTSKTVYGLQPRGSLIVPNVKPFLVENLNGARYEPEELLGSRHVVVDTKINQARIYESTPSAIPVGEDGDLQVKANRALIASFPITPGQPRFIKYGLWEMRNAVQLPVWRYDQSLLDGKGRSNNALNIPPGPNSPVGVIWMGLSVPGIGMHGTSDPETIGRARSAGCIRLANWDAVRVPDFVRPGATVEIR